METDKAGQTRVITALLDLYQDSLGEIGARVRCLSRDQTGAIPMENYYYS